MTKRLCPDCHGEGEITFNPRYPDPQFEDSARCAKCHGEGEVELDPPNCPTCGSNDPRDRAIDLLMLASCTDSWHDE